MLKFEQTLKLNNMELDIKKLTICPNDKWEAIDLLNSTRSDLLDALHILISMVEFPEEQFKETNTNRANKFLKKFTKD